MYVNTFAMQLSGPFDPDVFLKQLGGNSTSSAQTFDDDVPNDIESGGIPSVDREGSDLERDAVAPTWYSGNPTINQALVLAIETRLLNAKEDVYPNKLRFARSGAAHLSHQTALQLSKLLGIPVLPAYGMSECRPVCLSSLSPIRWNREFDCEEGTPETVGVPIGPSVRILGEDGSCLARGCKYYVEVVVGGPGVISKYWGVPRSESHTLDGFLRTGDYGCLDDQGQLYLKGRKKELIKRGGEQVWPNEIDDAVERVKGVQKAVGFGVKNDLWGEEVAVAVVLVAGGDASIEDRRRLERDILAACRENLKPAAVPVQIVFLESMDDLPIGATGKVQRNKVADHLNVVAKDHMLLRTLSISTESPDAVIDERPILQLPMSLNGVRFLAACSVVMKHVGSYPNGLVEKGVQFYQAPVILLSLSVFQHTVGAKPNLTKMWKLFVGNKIGTMHALFVTTQVVALASYLTFQCGDQGFQENALGSSCSDGSFLSKTLGNFIGTSLLTPFFPHNVVNVSWPIHRLHFDTFDVCMISLTSSCRRCMHGSRPCSIPSSSSSQCFTNTCMECLQRQRRFASSFPWYHPQ